VGQHAAREKVPKLLLDEPGEPAALAVVRRRAEKRFQVLADHGVEHRMLGVTGPIRRPGTDHAPG
jgi:hypothetical protein